MAEIQLTQNKFAIVDNEDFEWLNKWNWVAMKNHSGNWYAIGYINGQHQLMHRFILGLPPKREDERDVDHKNVNSLDNRRHNIRICDRTQNNGNRRKRKNCSSKFKGVYFRKNQQDWRSRITINGETIHLGCFDSELNAAKVYDDAAKEYFGDFARVNIN